MHLPGRCLSGFSLLLKFFFQLSIPLSSFLWFLWWIWWLYQLSSTFLDSLLSSFVGPYHRPFCSVSIPWLCFSALLCSPWECTDQCTVNPLFFLFHPFCSFSAFLSVSYTPSPDLYPRPSVREGSNYMYLCLILLPLLVDIFLIILIVLS